MYLDAIRPPLGRDYGVRTHLVQVPVSLRHNNERGGNTMKLKAISRVLATISIGAALASASALVSAAQKDDLENWPSRSIRFITPAAPGGTTDQLARLFSARLTEVFKQQVIVDNRASASGVIAGELTAQAAPDGYTLFLPYHQHTINAALLSKLP